ncbi:hypothetical protein DPMN_165648 [Dreissena polymorpha]|uniref:Uncharacterized protein n=1 Tax=Dreissena polymorpha TaxID=45954 RepID=A0A9D4EV95_DREPO|nr:hypothetical protein DPMN_165648 [Dreissena polymorpha]
METIGNLYNLYFVGKLMELLVHNVLSLAIAAVAMAILFRSPAVLVPSLDKVFPRYYKVVTSASFLSLTVMSAPVLVCS